MALNTIYQPATDRGSGPTPGAKALMSWYLGAYADQTNPRAANLGIYNPKRLGSGWSLHAEGRACDLGTAPYSKPPWGWSLANTLVEHSRELGVQCVIFDRRIWSSAYPYSGWRTYSGSDPHGGHLHVELTRAAAKSLTAQAVDDILGDRAEAPPPTADWRKEVIVNMNLVNLSRVTGSSSTWVRGADVRRLQGLLMADGYGPKGLAGSNGRPDGIAGPATRKALGEAQRKYRTGKPSSPGTPDYIAGRGTWAALAGVDL